MDTKQSIANKPKDMKKLIFLLLSSLFFAACSESPKQATKETQEKTITNPINPNGDSELALLMREMEAHWKVTKQHIQEGKDIPALPSFGSLLTATPTDESMKNETFDGFAKAYLTKIQNLGKADAAHKKEAYNEVVNACVYCHDFSCGGPIPRIKKLLLH